MTCLFYVLSPFFDYGGLQQAFLIMVFSNKPVIRPGGQSDQLSTSEFSFSSVLGRVSRSSPPFQTKCHAQELATYSCFLIGCFEYFFDFLQTYFFIMYYCNHLGGTHHVSAHVHTLSFMVLKELLLLWQQSPEADYENVKDQR